MQHATTSLELAEQRTHRPASPRRRTLVQRIGVVAIAAALVGTVALPAVGLQAAQAEPQAQQLDGSIAELLAQTQQQVDVQQSALVEDIAMNGLSATTPEELAAAQEAAAAAEAERQAELAAAQEAAAAATAAASTSPAATTTGATSAVQQAAPVQTAGGIVGIAQSQLGAPYVFGGASPATGFDCSGFTQWVFGQAGIMLPRIDSAQATAGTGVPLSEIQPGDLIAWRGHVAIYVGNDTIIHAATSASPVKYSSLSGMIAAMGTPQVRRF